MNHAAFDPYMLTGNCMYRKGSLLVKTDHVVETCICCWKRCRPSRCHAGYLYMHSLHLRLPSSLYCIKARLKFSCNAHNYGQNKMWPKETQQIKISSRNTFEDWINIFFKNYQQTYYIKSNHSRVRMLQSVCISVHNFQQNCTNFYEVWDGEYVTKE